MKDIILTLITALSGSLSWAKEFRLFLNCSETVLLSDQPGSYTVEDLLAELIIRHRSAEKSGIETIGMKELMDKIRNLSANDVIKNYTFNNQDRTGVIYLDEDGAGIIGAVLVRTDK